MIQQEKFGHKILEYSPVRGLGGDTDVADLAAVFHQSLRKAFTFNRRERWGLIFLLGGLGGLYGLTFLFPARPLPEGPGFVQGPNDSDKNQDQGIIKNKSPHISLPLEPFDPHEISEQGWVDRGLSARTARTIRNYLSKGGRFRRTEDLKKIWGLRPADYERLRPYVRIRKVEELERRTGEHDGWSQKKSTWKSFEPVARVSTTVDINRSDSAQWEILPGIGPGYARRIIRYRDRLGGFVHLDQVAETYQLPDSVYQRIRPLLTQPESGIIRRISLNTAPLDSLGRHPYIGFSKARLIVRYREQHGSFTEVERLLDIETLDPVWLKRIQVYLTL